MKKRSKKPAKAVRDMPLASRSEFHLPVVFGKDLDGKAMECDLAAAPNMFIGGESGHGASPFLHSLICGLAASHSPEEVRFILIDPRSTELDPYAKLPNLIVPIINDRRRIIYGMRWAESEMESRLKMFSRVMVRNIEEFNSRDRNAPVSDMFGDDTPAADVPDNMLYIVIVINGFDKDMAREIKPCILHLAAKGRAAGIHLILATKRIDKWVLLDVLKVHIPIRVAFKTASAKDSKMILDEAGAESLMGTGDALVKCPDGVVRHVQTQSISDAEIDAIVANCVKSNSAKVAANASKRRDYRTAYKIVVQTQRASTSHLQRRMGIGYNHAAALIDELVANGVIGPQKGAMPRKVLVDSLPPPNMAEMEMTIRIPFEDLEDLRQLARDKGCEVDDIASELIREQLKKIV